MIQAKSKRAVSGPQLRREASEPRQRREISAGFLVFRRTSEGPKFLILYHGHNYWNFPKGHIESEEKSLRAAFRETREETGLTDRDLRMVENFKVYQKYFFKQSGRPIFKIVIFYLAETKNSRIKISSEHQGYGWFLYPEAMRILGRYRGNQAILKQTYGSIQNAEKRGHNRGLTQK